MKQFVKVAILLIGVIICPWCLAQPRYTKISAFSLNEVRLLESPFKKAQQTDMNYMLALNPDRLLAPYLREAGLPKKADSYGNWENTGLDGHIAGHYLSALANMYAATGDAMVKQRLAYMLSELQRCQEQNGDGYIAGIPGGKGMWKEIEQGKINSSGFSLNGKWVPLYNIHKLVSGLYDAYTVGDQAIAKSMLVKLCDWFVRLSDHLTDQQIQTMLTSEHGGLNEVFANTYAITGNRQYLTLARRFSHLALLNPLLNHRDELNSLHANMQIPKVVGYERIAQLDADTAWDNAADFFWHTVVQHRSISIGGNSVREHFNPANDFSSMIETNQGPETCNSYNMLKLTKELFLNHGGGDYMDFYERVVYNHILSTQRPEGGFVYFTPIRPGHYRVYSSPQESFWCCVGSGLENHGKYGEMVYAHQGQDLLVNLFVPSVLNWEQRGIMVHQYTAFPYKSETLIELTMKSFAAFKILIRKPYWIGGETLQLQINGKSLKVKENSDHYIVLQRQWKNGDRIKLALPMQTHAEFLPDSSNWVSFLYGPIVLAAPLHTTDQPGLTANADRMGHIAAGSMLPLDKAPMVVAPNRNIGREISQTDGNLKFNASSLIFQQNYKSLQLQPFFELHDTRYVVYWPYTSLKDLPALEEKMHREETARRKLDSITVDVVYAGEQQPESDHEFKGETTSTGVLKDRHYRNASGWFSYALQNKSNASKLRVTFYGPERNREFDIYVNNKLLKHVAFTVGETNQFFDMDMPLPEGVVKDSKVEVKFQGLAGSGVANIFEVRLIK